MEYLSFKPVVGDNWKMQCKICKKEDPEYYLIRSKDIWYSLEEKENQKMSHVHPMCAWLDGL